MNKSQLFEKHKDNPKIVKKKKQIIKWKTNYWKKWEYLWNRKVEKETKIHFFNKISK